MPTKKKICERCQQGKPATHEFFASDFRMPDQLSQNCLVCRYAIRVERRQRKNELSKAWYAANKEKARESAKRSWERNREERLAYLRQWKKENKERIQEYQRAYAERKRQEQSAM